MTAARDLLYGLVLEDGRRWGEAATDAQRADADAILDEHSDTPYHWLSRARGYSKTTDLAGISVSILLGQAPPRARLFGLAADQSQGQLLLDAIGGYMARTPELGGALQLQEFRVIAPRSGATLTILPADSASIWGLRPYFVVVDEVSVWHETPRTLRVWEGLTTGLAKVPGSRMAVLGTAGEPGHFSYGIRNQALDDPLWRVHEVAGPPPWMEKKRLEGERRRLPESSYRRLFLNEWVASEDRLADEDDLLACVTLDGSLAPRPGMRYVIGVDIGVKHDATAVVIAHAEQIPGAEHPRVVVDRLMTWTPARLRPVKLSVVEEWIEEYARRYNRASVRFDPSQGIHMMQRLKRTGLSVQEFTFSAGSVGKLASVLLQLIREHALSLPDDADLLDELRNVRLRESSPGVYRLDHDRNRHDDRAVALALAASALVERGSARPLRTASAVRDRGGRPRGFRARPEAELRAAQRSLEERIGRASDPVADALGATTYTSASIKQAEDLALGRRRRSRGYWSQPR